MRCAECTAAATHVTRTGSPLCASHAPADAWEPPSDMLRRAVAYRRAQQPARGVVSDALLDALGPWAKPHQRHDAEWRARVRQLLAESPLRDVVSACLEARMAVERRRE